MFQQNYVCINYIGKPSALVTGSCDAGFHQQIIVLSLTPVELDKVLADTAIAKQAAEAEAERLDLLRSLEDIRQKQHRLYNSFRHGGLDPTDLNEQATALRYEETSLRNRLTATHQILADFGYRQRAVEQLKANLLQASEVILELVPEKQLEMVHQMFSRIWVDRTGEVRVEFRA